MGLLIVVLSYMFVPELVSSMEELGKTFGDLGLSLVQTSRFEEAMAGQVGQYSDTGAAASTIAADAKRVGMVRSMGSCWETSLFL